MDSIRRQQQGIIPILTTVNLASLLAQDEEIRATNKPRLRIDDEAAIRYFLVYIMGQHYTSSVGTKVECLEHRIVLECGDNRWL
jgi:hypothetical protein